MGETKKAMLWLRRDGMWISAILCDSRPKPDDYQEHDFCCRKWSLFAPPIRHEAWRPYKLTLTEIKKVRPRG